MHLYTEHFGLKLLPFENVSDPRFFFGQGEHARIYQRLIESLNSSQGLTVVTGDIGAGKTMLSQMLIYNNSNDTKHIWIAEPPEKSISLFLFIALELGLEPSTSEKTFVLRDIKDELIRIRSEGKKCMVILDESQTIADEVLDGIQLLNNLEEDARKLIQVYLFGQEEIMAIINSPANESFKQRIAILETMGKMNNDKIRDYITHRLNVAGGQPSIFTDAGWGAIHSVFGNEGSIPRVINSLCDKSLIVASERENDKVDYYDVYVAARELGIYNEISHHKAKHKQSMKKYSFPDNWENVFFKDAETVYEEPVQSFSEESEAAETEHGKGQSGTPDSPQNGSENNELAKKVRENYFSGFFRNIMVKKNEMPEEIEDNKTDIANVSDREREEPAEASEPGNSSELITKETTGENSFKPAEIKDDNLTIKEETSAAASTTSSEWVTVDSQGEKPFDPEVLEKIKPTSMKEIATKLDEWETYRGKV